MSNLARVVFGGAVALGLAFCIAIVREWLREADEPETLPNCDWLGW